MTTKNAAWPEERTSNLVKKMVRANGTLVLDAQFTKMLIRLIEIEEAAAENGRRAISEMRQACDALIEAVQPHGP